jgi:uncharacterized protein
VGELAVQYYVTLTLECNLKCSYCYGKCCDDFGVDFDSLQIDYSVPTSITYGLAKLQSFLRKDPDPAIVFYGGEPLLRLDMLQRIMDSVAAKKFILQTNGTLLHELAPEYVHRFDTILVSIDGGKEITDHYRGDGVYEQVTRNVRRLRDEGFAGELIARMTVGRETRIDREVCSLLFNEGLFDSIHWQLDALFWHNDYDKEGFSKWMDADYNPAVKKLIDIWVRHMEDHGQVLRIYPFVGIMRSLILDEPAKLRCGAGYAMFNIQTDGNITPCPVMAGMKDFYLGNIESLNPSELPLRAVYVSEPCTNCKTYPLCGGRCLYANITKLWGEEGFRLVCSSVENLVDSLKSVVPTILRLISKGRVRLCDFDYPRFNSCEIIP